jgi:hypothetical protein
MNESQIESFPHLFEFIEKHVGENTGVVSPEVADELKMLIESYEGYTPPKEDTEYKNLIDCLSAREEENQVLKLELKELTKKLQEQDHISSKIRKTVMEHKFLQEELDNDHNDKITELTEHLQRTRLSLDNLTHEHARLKEEHAVKELRLADVEKRYVDVQCRFDKEFKAKETSAVQTIQDCELLKTALDAKKEECTTLHKTLNKLKGQKDKLMQKGNILIQTSRANENIVNNFQKEIKELKESKEILAADYERRIQGYINLINDLKQGQNQERINEVFAAHPEINHPEEQESPGKLPFGNLEDYAEFFSSDRNINMFPNDNLDNVNSSYNNIVNSSFHRRLSGVREMSFNMENDPQLSNDEDDDPTIVFPKPSKRVEEEPHDDKIQDNLSDIDFKLERALSKPKPSPLSITEVYENTGPRSKFGTNKSDIKDKIDELISKRMTVSAIRAPRIEAVAEPQFIYEESPLQHELHSILETSPVQADRGSSELRVSQINEDTAISLETFAAMLEFLDNYLSGSKNPTTLTLTDCERKNITNKFSNASTQNFRKFFVLVMKFFLEYVNFLEKQISNLIHSKSYLEIKIENMKSEFNFLLRNFMDKNQKCQEFLNDVNIKFSHLKLANRSRLSNLQDTFSRREPSVVHRGAKDSTGQRKTANAKEITVQKTPTKEAGKQSSRKHQTSLEDASQSEIINEKKARRKNAESKNTETAKESKVAPKEENFISKIFSSLTFK